MLYQFKPRILAKTAVLNVLLLSGVLTAHSREQRHSDEWLTNENDPKYTESSPILFPRYSSNEEFQRLVDEAKKKESEGNPQRAKDLYESALNQSGFTTWRDPQIVRIISRLAEICQNLGMTNEAWKYKRQLADLAKEEKYKFNSSGVDSAHDAESRLLLADTLASEGKDAEAERLYRGGFTATYDPDLDFFLKALIAERLVRLHIKEGEREEAANDINTVHDLVSATYDTTHSETALRALLCTLSGKVGLCLYEHKISEAAILSDRCLQLLPKSNTASSYRRMMIFADRAKLYMEKEDYPTALSYFNRALSAATHGRALPRIHVDPVKLAMAECYKKMGKNVKAEEMTNECAKP